MSVPTGKNTKFAFGVLHINSNLYGCAPFGKKLLKSLHLSSTDSPSFSKIAQTFSKRKEQIDTNHNIAKKKPCIQRPLSNRCAFVKVARKFTVKRRVTEPSAEKTVQHFNELMAATRS
eukprot:GHVT01041377.1.p1 GENE.GHVT01041377.1~~GHVT01041377.1.p1  ORF type:complete len:118 (-),score=4.46 GHVT01041377.1:247-600(-)